VSSPPPRICRPADRPWPWTPRSRTSANASSPGC